jgi:hypothetical protein
VEVVVVLGLVMEVLEVLVEETLEVLLMLMVEVVVEQVLYFKVLKEEEETPLITEKVVVAELV